MQSSPSDRPYGSFRKPHRDGILETPPPPKKPGWRERLSRLRARTRGAQLVGASVLIALAVVAFGSALNPGEPRLTRRDVDEAIRRALESSTPKPSLAVAAYEKVRKSVVEVKARSNSAEGRWQVRGAGIVLDEGGNILTSLQVVRDAADIGVVFHDGTETPARILAEDAEHDVAVLETQSPPVPTTAAVLASSGRLRVGDEAIVIGSPFALKDSMSMGVISGLRRTFQTTARSEPLAGLIQFDAAVNPGNVGGPLVNRHGDVVGIVIGLANPTGQGVFVGIGFAVPIEAASSAAGSFPY